MRLFIAVGCLALMVVTLQAGEEKIPLDKVPKPVLDAVKARFKDAKLTEASKETEDGKTVYEAVVNKSGKEWSIEVNEQGKFLKEYQESKEKEEHGEKGEKGEK